MSGLTFDYDFTKYLYEVNSGLIKGFKSVDGNQKIIKLNKEEKKIFWKLYKKENPDLLRIDRLKKLERVIKKK